MWRWSHTPLPAAQGYPRDRTIQVDALCPGVHHGIVTTPVESAHEPAHRGFRLFVVVASVIAAAVGSVVLAVHDSTKTATARAAAGTFRLPGHPGAVAG